MSTKYSEYVPKWERPVITKLIELLLADHCKLAIHDGEEFAVRTTDKQEELIPALGSTGEDTIHIWDQDGHKDGWFSLIYNNGSEGDPMIVISDYVVTERNERIWGELNEEFG